MHKHMDRNCHEFKAKAYATHLDGKCPIDVSYE